MINVLCLPPLITNMMYVSSHYCRVTARFPFQRRSLHHHHDDHRSLRASMHTGHEVVTEASSRSVLTLDMTKEKIRKLFKNVEISVSSYDTAWVAMVPSPNSPNSPCFPECVNWLMDNQLDDGSWGLVPYHPTLLKEALSSTLACVIALKRWNVGEDQINKGMCFIESNFASVADENQYSPFGFEIIFPGMLEYAKDLNLNFAFQQEDVSVMLHERELEIMRCHSQEREPYLAYISEGLGDFHDRDMVMKYQMKNGSLFNSPSATAAALVRHHNTGCVNYLTSLLKKFGNAVPTVYPLDIYVRLCMVDTLTSLGITRHFREEIQNVLDETYRCWVQGDEQIFMDVATCALAFRLLRTNGYEVSSDPLAEITKEEAVLNSYKEPFKDVYSAIEVYKASQIMYQQELDFGKQKLRSMEFLERKISKVSIPSDMSSKYIQLQVDNALRFPFHASLERISTRRNIQNYNVDNNTRTLKTTFRSLNISNKEYLTLAVEDFNACQSIHREELKDLEKWVVKNRLEELKFVRQKTAYCYFSAALTFPYPELSDARISWTKSSILTGVVDDFFDVGGSLDELVNLIQCVEKWNINADNDCCSKEVRIIFLALKDVILWIGERGFKRQKRSVTSHVIQTWLTLMQTMFKEAVWSRDNSVPTMNEYMENGYVTIALGPIVLPSLYFVGPKLSEEIVHSSEYHNLFELMSIQGRLLNDIQSYKRELKAGKLNAVTLHTSNENSGITEEEVIKEIKMFVNDKRKELKRLVVQGNGSIVPKACKDVFWSMCNVLNLFYATNDGYSGNDILEIVKEIIYEPVFPNAGY